MDKINNTDVPSIFASDDETLEQTKPKVENLDHHFPERIIGDNARYDEKGRRKKPSSADDDEERGNFNNIPSIIVTGVECTTNTENNAKIGGIVKEGDSSLLRVKPRYTNALKKRNAERIIERELAQAAIAKRESKGEETEVFITKSYARRLEKHKAYREELKNQERKKSGKDFRQAILEKEQRRRRARLNNPQYDF